MRVAGAGTAAGLGKLPLEPITLISYQHDLGRSIRKRSRQRESALLLRLSGFSASVANGRLESETKAEEIQIRRQLATLRKYPRWRGNYIGGYCYYIAAESFIEEAFRQRDGTWAVGRESEGTARVFANLREALKYGEYLASRKLADRRYSAFSVLDDSQIMIDMRNEGPP